MMPTIPPSAKSLSLEEILRREDTWRGRSHRLAARPALDTGHEALNSGLLNGGWPLGSLTEICQQRYHGEWQLFMPALSSGISGSIVLLNPPAEPFAQALIQAGLDLDRLVIVEAADRAPFVACFTGLTRTGACDAILAWQPKGNLTYTELRKCQLSASEGAGLYVMFRPLPVQRQSSPASLRLSSRMVPAGLEVVIFKQKGVLLQQQARPVVLPRPDEWEKSPPYHGLGHKPWPGKADDVTSKPTSVSSLRGKS